MDIKVLKRPLLTNDEIRQKGKERENKREKETKRKEKEEKKKKNCPAHTDVFRSTIQTKDWQINGYLTARKGNINKKASKIFT
jgi:hypothetical protein